MNIFKEYDILVNKKKEYDLHKGMIAILTNQKEVEYKRYLDFDNKSAKDRSNCAEKMIKEEKDKLNDIMSEQELRRLNDIKGIFVASGVMILMVIIIIANII